MEEEKEAGWGEQSWNLIVTSPKNTTVESLPFKLRKKIFKNRSMCCSDEVGVPNSNLTPIFSELKGSDNLSRNKF